LEACSWQKVEEWMELYGDRIIRVVYLILDDYHLAEEITQEVFIRAYNSMDSFRGESSPYTWLYRIALNLSKNSLKRKAKISFLPLSMRKKEKDVLAEPLDEKVIRLTTGKKLRNCVLELPLIYHEVIILRYFDDLKISEIAHILHQPEGTVKSKLSRGRELLEAIMRKEGLEYGEER
jgi:RNA polymerase sigma-70 factor (ECF subfamily)